VVVQRPGSILASLNAPLIRRFGVTRALSRPPAVMILDGARNHESATSCAAAPLWGNASPVIDFHP